MDENLAKQERKALKELQEDQNLVIRKADKGNILVKTRKDYYCNALNSDSHLRKKFFFVCFNESPLKILENSFYFMSNALFVLQIIKFLSKLFYHVLKRLDQKAKVNFKICDVTYWTANSFNTHIAQYLKKLSQPGTEI